MYACMYNERNLMQKYIFCSIYYEVYCPTIMVLLGKTSSCLGMVWTMYGLLTDDLNFNLLLLGTILGR